jgi:hypothetical protein
MAKIYDSFETIPINRNARKKMFREARKGTRPSPGGLDAGDAARAISAAAAYKSGWESAQHEPARTIRAAWNAAKDS